MVQRQQGGYISSVWPKAMTGQEIARSHPSRRNESQNASLMGKLETIQIVEVQRDHDATV